MTKDDGERKRLLDELQTLRARVRELETATCISTSQVATKLASRGVHSSSEDSLRMLIRAIPDLVWLKDTEGVFLYCNESFELFIGKKESEIIGKTDYQLVDKDSADFFRAKDKVALEADAPCVNEEWLTIANTGKTQLFETIKTPLKDNSGNRLGVLGVARDVTRRKHAEEALEKRIVALTRPLEDPEGVTFEDLFNLKDIQRLQDQFAEATGVGSLITRPNGTPITRPSNFCRFCNDVIRNSPKGRENCRKSDAAVGQLKKDGPTVRPCKSGGLWDAGAGIAVGGRHVASWLVGQVRDDRHTPEMMRAYAREIGADEEEIVEAFEEVTSMAPEKFKRIAEMLFTLANQLSDIAFQNVQQARFIADLKKAEVELAKTRNYLSNIIDSMPSMVVGVDTECNVTQWNMEAERITNIAPQDAIGRPLHSVLPFLSREVERVRESIRTRTTCSDLLQVRSASGEVQHENVTIYPLIANGVDGAVVRVDDVTDRVNLEQIMVQSEKMMSVGGLAAGMAHEINNPLAAILGYTQNIKKRVFGGLKKNHAVAEECGVSLENVQEYLKHREIPRMLDGIHESGARAANIVANMLSFSRKTEKELKRHDLALLLDATLELAANDYNLKKYYDFRKIKIIREYDEASLPVHCDGNEIQQVFFNLLKNGAEAMMDKDYEDVPPTITCRVKQVGGMAVVEIEDNGPGMDDAVRKRIFEPFYTTKEVGKGTGLGLSVSYFIITDQHKGCMEVESAIGEWTRFSIKLPIDLEENNGA